MRALSYDEHCAAAAAILAHLAWSTGLIVEASNLARDAIRFCAPQRDKRDALVELWARETLAYSLLHQYTARFDPKKIEEAERILTALLRVRPSADVNRCLAIIRYEQRRMAEAREYALAAAALGPESPYCSWTLAGVELVTGDLGPGWRRFNVVRYVCSGVQEPKWERVWDGSNPAGKTILIRDDMCGLGDFVHYVRYAEAIEKARGRAIVECPERFTAMMSRVKGVSAVVKPGDELPAYDFCVGLMSLPEKCGTETVSDIWWTGPYIAPESAKVEAWRDRIAGLSGGRLKVGLSWAVGEIDTDRRAIPLHALAQLGSIPGVALFGLQRGPNAIEAEIERRPGFDVVSLEDADGTPMDTAAAMLNLDLIISVDTMTCHLAGALGCPVWTMLPHNHDWRWLLDRSDSPWYPTMRLFRQEVPGDWSPVVQEVCAELAKVATAHRLQASTP